MGMVVGLKSNTLTIQNILLIRLKSQKLVLYVAEN